MFVLDLPENENKGVFENIVILCPTIEWNKATKTGAGLVTCVIQKTKNITIVNPVMRGGTKRL